MISYGSAYRATAVRWSQIDLSNKSAIKESSASRDSSSIDDADKKYVAAGNSSNPGWTFHAGVETKDAPEDLISISAEKSYNKSIFEKKTDNDATTERLRTDYAYSPDSKSFIEKADSKSFSPNQNTIEIFGGTSEDFKQAKREAAKKEDPLVAMSIGDSWGAEGFLGYKAGDEYGDEDLGASWEAKAGAEGSVSAEYGFDGEKFDATVGAEVSVGVSVEAEGHFKKGPAEVTASIEAEAGAEARANAGITFDPTEGVSAEFEAQAFAGVQARVETGIGLGESADAAAGVDFKAGIGAEARGDVEVGLDEIGVDLEIGATLGIGADVSVDLSISPKGIVADAEKYGEDAKDFIGGLFG